MSDTSSTALVVGGGGEVGHGGYKTPFTAMQWQELEHQAKIYKYMVAGLPVPPDLVVPIRRSLEALSARFLSYPSLGYCSYYGKKFDPEPGRCRRTDGKKWRCSKDAHPDSKYCERHMHRGRNRSRKPVESSQQSAPLSQSLSTTMSHIINNNSNHNNASGTFQVSGSGSFRNVPLCTFAGSQGSSIGSSNVTKLQMERPITYEMDGNSIKEIRYIHGLNPDHSFSPEASRSFGSLGLGSNRGTWRLASSQVSDSTNFLKHRSDDPMLLNPITVVQENATHHGLEHINASSTTPSSKQRQHCFLDHEIGSEKLEQQQQQHLIHPFFSEWPATKESWSALDDDDDTNDGSNKNVFSSTRLSISIPRSLSDSSRSPNNG